MLAKPSKRWLIALLVLSLLLGVVIGVLIDQQVLNPAEALPAPETGATRPRWERPGGQPPKDRMILWLTHQLHLTDRQQTALGALLEKQQSAQRECHLRQREEFSQMRERFMDEIETELDGSQIDEFREMRRQMELTREMDMLKSRHRGFPGGPGRNMEGEQSR